MSASHPVDADWRSPPGVTLPPVRTFAVALLVSALLWLGIVASLAALAQ